MPDTATPRPADPNEFFPGNANRVRNKTVVLSASVTRQIRNMASLPEQIIPGAEATENEPVANGNTSTVRPLNTDPERPAPGPVLGFLVSYDRNSEGEVYPLRKGRWIITSRWADPSGDCILIDDETISFAHAIIRIDSTDSIQLMDQLSTTGSGIVRLGANYEEPLREAASFVKQGDIIRFGNRRFHVCLVQGATFPEQQPAN